MGRGIMSFSNTCFPQINPPLTNNALVGLSFKKGCLVEQNKDTCGDIGH